MASTAVASIQAPLSRPYRSKRARPCDLCRSRKACCRIYIAPPCGLCEKLGMDCSFTENPSKRQAQRQRHDGSSQRRHEVASPEPVSLQPSAVVQLPGHDDRAGQDRANTAESFQLAPQVLSPNPRSQQSVDDEIARDATRPLLPSPNDIDMNTNYMQFDYSQPGDAVANMLEDANITNLYHPDNDDFANLMSGGYIDVLGGDTDGGESAEFNEAALIRTDNPCDNLGVSQDRLAINSIDDKIGTNAQYFGLSGESDPYLLRHYRYNNSGEFNQFKLSYRKVADDNSSAEWSYFQPPNDVPVYFKISADDLEGEMKEETSIRPNASAEMTRKELYELVQIEDGCRLMDLFLKYVFPSFPAISRSQLGITVTNPTASPSTLERIPTHLLAAIYASALIYCPHDDYLCVSNVYSQPSATKIWRIAYEEIFREIHTPHLSLVQAILLYLQKPRSGQSSVASDTPFHWSLMSMLMAVSTSLALHLDCHQWNIPPWEKRLRRRLWWMVYVEEKWRCLLGGYPSLISSDQWDVSELTEEDFFVDAVNASDNSVPTNGGDRGFESGVRFCHLAQLSLISEEVYTSFYTLRSSRLLSRDFDASLTTAQPIHLRLKAWYSGLPASLRIRKRSMLDESRFAELESNSALHFAYLSLEILLYRALLRPLNLSRDPNPAIDVNNREGIGFSGNYGVAWSSPRSPYGGIEGNHEAAEAVIVAAEKCAKIVTDFTAGLDSQNFSAGYWYSWSRIGFATMSNLAMLLLVKAPDAEHLLAAKQIMQNWRRVLRYQSQSFAQMKMGYLRLEVMLWKGMDDYIMDGRRRDVKG